MSPAASLLSNSWRLLASTQTAQTTFEFARWRTWGDLVVPAVAFLVIVLAVRWLYRRDAHELSFPLRFVLLVLRVAVFFGLLLLYLDPQWHTRDTPRVLLLVDTSSSMGLRDAAADGRPESQGRAERLASVLTEHQVIDRLRATHDVVVARFDTSMTRLATFPRVGGSRRSRDVPETLHIETPPAAETALDWHEAIAPRGAETRLGASLERLVREERFGPASAIFLLSDGGQNAGDSPDAALRLASDAGLPIHTIGIGALEQPLNVRVEEFNAPPKARPGDSFAVAGLIRLDGERSHGDDIAVTVELWRREADPGAEPSDLGRRVDSQRVDLGSATPVAPVRFLVEPEEVGRFTWTLRVVAPFEDFNSEDNQLQADVEVVDRKDRVLLLAGGPVRDYGFLRPQLHRDETIAVDVYLQSRQEGVSQEAEQLLTEFPSRREDMDYDCVLAFDFDWLELSDAQIDLLEDWVGNRGGGLIVTAGPVHAGAAVGSWTVHPRMRKIRALYPVDFDQQTLVQASRTRTSAQALELELTPEGAAAEYLWIADDPIASREAWREFPGVHSFQSVTGLKPAAVALARFSDPRLGRLGAPPVYFAEQFYGSGRVFYLGSSEIWRLRVLDVAYFERFYTKLIRHVGQGRLLRDSDRATFTTERERYTVGATVVVRARLRDARGEPFEGGPLMLDLFAPSGVASTVELRPDADRAGHYVGQFAASEPGGYRLELPLPDTHERVTRRIQVRMPDLETEDPRRNTALLERIAEETGGVYLDNHSTALDPRSEDNIYTILVSSSIGNPPPSSPDLERERFWMAWLLGFLCGTLCLEWLIRRLARLA